MEETGGNAPSARRHLAHLSGLALAIFLLEALRPALGSDMRYVEACREMSSSGDWLIPHLAFVPYFEKPILIYWFGAACQWLCGESAIAYQLPSVLSSLISLVVAYLWASSWHGPRFAWWTALLLLGSGMFLAMGSILTVDPLLAACVTAAFFAFFRHDRGDGSRWIWIFWLSAGVGALAKGPLAWVLIASGIAPYLLLSRSLRAAARAIWAMRPLSGLAILLVVNLPWWYAVWRQDPRFVEFFFIRINLQAFADPSINHPGPPWFYLGILTIGLFPFSVLIVPLLAMRLVAIGKLLWTQCRERMRGQAVSTPAQEHPQLYLWCIAIFPFLFLSVSASKLPLYILPLMPAFVLLAADDLRRHLEKPPRWMYQALLAQLLLILPAVAIYLLVGFHPETISGVSHPALALLAIGIGGMILSIGRALTELRRAYLVRALAMLGAGGVSAALLSGPFITQLRMSGNAAPLARYVATHRQDGDQVVVSSALAQDYEIVMALRERVHYCGAVRELGMGHFTECTGRGQRLPQRPEAVAGDNLPQNRYLLSEESLGRRWGSGGRIWVFADGGLEQRLREAHLLVFEIARTRKALLLSNHPADAAP